MNNTAIINNENIIDMRDIKEKKAEYKKLRKEFKKQKKIKRTAVEHAISLIFILFAAEAVMYLLIKPYVININDLLAHEICMAFTALIGILINLGFSKVKLTERVSVKNLDFLSIAMLTVAAFSGPELVDNISGAILSHFMTVEPNPEEQNTLVNIISAVVCAPIFEELICRFGFMELTRKHYSAKFVIIFAAFLFTLLHGYNIQGFLNVFTGAIMMGIVYYYTNNLILTMAEHALHNTICCITPSDMSIFGTPIYHETNGFVISSPAWIVINAVLFAASAVVFVKYFVPKYMSKKNEAE